MPDPLKPTHQLLQAIRPTSTGWYAGVTYGVQGHIYDDDREGYGWEVGDDIGSAPDLDGAAEAVWQRVREFKPSGKVWKREVSDA